MLTDAEMNGAILHLQQIAREIYSGGRLALLPKDEQHQELANLVRENFFAKAVINAPEFVEAIVGERISGLARAVIAEAQLKAERRAAQAAPPTDADAANHYRLAQAEKLLNRAGYPSVDPPRPAA